MNTPFQYSVRINIDDKAVDYLLTIDETGHVYEAKPLIFDLPEATQKLFLGKSDGQLKRKIDAFAKLSYYLLPLALTGRMLAFQKELAPLVKDIKRRLADKKMQWRDLAAFATPGAIPSEVLNVFGTNNKPNIKQQSFWENIIYLLNIEKKGDRKRDGHAIASLAQSKPEAAIAFFQAVIPFLNHANQRTAFEQFSKIKSESIKRYLLKELAFPFTPVQVSTGILKALYGYPKGDQEIYEAVLRHHRNVSKRDHENFAASVRIMGQYPTIEARDLVFGILRLDNRQSAAPACAALLNMGTPPKEIAKDLLPSLRAAMPNRSEAAFHVFAKFDQLREYLPDAVEMLDILVKALLQFSNIPLGLPALAYKAGVYELNDNIYELLNHESPVVRRGLLFLIASVVFRESGFNPNPYHTPKMLKRYLILINDTDEEVAKAAVRLLGDIGLKRDGSQFIEPLVILYKNKPSKNTPPYSNPRSH